jgi:GMP synthase-like glutamine amidotransferase
MLAKPAPDQNQPTSKIQHPTSVQHSVLAFRHVPFEHLGRIADSLALHDITCEYVDLYRDASKPDIREADALIVMGGPMSVNDDLPFIRQELDLIGDAVSLGKPILGVCLGAQLIAKALGARVYANAVKELGWYPVYWTGAAERDPLHHGLAAPETVFHWHAETFDLPSGAELLAYSDACRHQAYRVGENIYGLQFHLEVTPEMVADWFDQDVNCGDTREIETPIDPYVNADRLTELAALVFGRWSRRISHA